MATYQVVVTPGGIVLSTPDIKMARETFQAYAQMSRQGQGNVTGMNVVLRDSFDIMDRYYGQRKFS